MDQIRVHFKLLGKDRYKRECFQCKYCSVVVTHSLSSEQRSHRTRVPVEQLLHNHVVRSHPAIKVGRSLVDDDDDDDDCDDYSNCDVRTFRASEKGAPSLDNDENELVVQWLHESQPQFDRSTRAEPWFQHMQRTLGYMPPDAATLSADGRARRPKRRTLDSGTTLAGHGQQRCVGSSFASSPSPSLSSSSSNSMLDDDDDLQQGCAVNEQKRQRGGPHRHIVKVIRR
jgi:hypothetical protein